MLVIRMQRTGRKGHAQFRIVVQDSRRTPTSGKLVASLGHFNPHTKETSLNKEKASFYLDHGAQPSERVIRLLQAEGVKLPTWVSVPSKKEGTVRHAEKRRSTRPAEPVAEEAPEQEAEVAVEPVETPAAEEAAVEEVAAEAPVEAATPAEEAETEPDSTAVEPAPKESPVAEDAKSAAK